jgi:hypothetical protein
LWGARVASLSARVARLSARVTGLAQSHAEWATTLVLTIGCWDGLHRGHVNLLAALRTFGARVLAGVHDDASIAAPKAQPPAVALAGRVDGIRRFVDAAFVVPDADPVPALAAVLRRAAPGLRWPPAVSAPPNTAAAAAAAAAALPTGGGAGSGGSGGGSGGDGGVTVIPCSDEWGVGGDGGGGGGGVRSVVYVRGDDMPVFPGRWWLEAVGVPVVLLPRTPAVSSSLFRLMRLPHHHTQHPHHHHHPSTTLLHPPPDVTGRAVAVGGGTGVGGPWRRRSHDTAGSAGGGSGGGSDSHGADSGAVGNARVEYDGEGGKKEEE